MTLDLARYFRPEERRLELRSLALRFFTKPGVRGYPGVHPGALLMAEALGRQGDLGDVLDLSASAGLLALALRTGKSNVTRLRVLEPSRAALACADATLAGLELSVAAGLPWDQGGEADTALLLPPTDRGTARVEAEIDGAHARLKTGGRLFAVMHKDEGAKRYERYLEARLGGLEVLAKRGGWRLVRGVKRQQDIREVDPLCFHAAGLELEADPGVFAAGKLDPGTAVLLDNLDLASLRGERVLDLGVGYGLLALKAAEAGAAVTGLDDDLAAVRSSRRNAARLGLKAEFLHSDVDRALDEGHFDTVLANPPFHVGKRVILDVPRAFVAAAHRRLVPGGQFVLVANAALPYEAELSAWASWREVSRARGFKVLEVRR